MLGEEAMEILVQYVLTKVERLDWEVGMISNVPGVSFYGNLYLNFVPKLLLRINLEPQILHPASPTVWG